MCDHSTSFREDIAREEGTPSRLSACTIVESERLFTRDYFAVDQGRVERCPSTANYVGRQIGPPPVLFIEPPTRAALERLVVG